MHKAHVPRHYLIGDFYIYRKAAILNLAIKGPTKIRVTFHKVVQVTRWHW